MKLEFYLLSRIAFVALMCLVTTAVYVLYSNDLQAREETQIVVESLSKQLELQLLRIQSGLGQANPFPDFELWKQSGNSAGVCLSFVPADGSLTRNICNGEKLSSPSWPGGFEFLYRLLFSPGLSISQPVRFNSGVIGLLTATPSADMEIARVWDNIRSLLGLSAMTILAVCTLVYLSISRALRPARIIVNGLARMEKGNLDYRLPRFNLFEWQRIAEEVNKLADSQQQLLEGRQKLAVKLINLQEEERRYLARELHDELGQCLAAINAVAASIAHTAEQQCPALVEEADHISRISQHMMDSVRDLLGRLRPAELDELGLTACLNSLVEGWNVRSGGKTRYQLSIIGDCTALPEPLAVTLFRIVQECLTNIAKHSSAANASVTLAITEDAIALTVKDDGIANEVPSVGASGIGLLGIRERVIELHGRLTLTIAQPHGFIIEVELPIRSITETQA